MKRSEFLLGTAAALLLAGGLFGMAKVLQKGTDWRVIQLLGGATSVQCVKEPQVVEAFLVDVSPAPAAGGDSSASPPPDLLAGSALRVAGHRVVAGPVVLQATDTAALREILLSAETYDWYANKRENRAQPLLGLRFVRDASRLEIAVSFADDTLTTWRLGRAVGYEDCDAARPALLALARRLFPQDARIGALPDRR